MGMVSVGGTVAWTGGGSEGVDFLCEPAGAISGQTSNAVAATQRTARKHELTPESGFAIVIYCLAKEERLWRARGLCCEVNFRRRRPALARRKALEVCWGRNGRRKGEPE